MAIPSSATKSFAYKETWILDWKKHKYGKKKTSDDALAQRAKTLARIDQFFLDLLSSGLSGGKIEQARQILQKVNQCNVISIDQKFRRLMLHGWDLSVTVFDFLNDLQTTTKNLNERNLSPVRRLKLPNFFFANTHAKRVATEIADLDNNGRDKIGGCSLAKWLRIYWASACC